MKLKSILIHILFIVGVFFAMDKTLDWFDQYTESIEKKQIGIIHDEIKDRLKVFFNVPISVGVMGAEYFSDGDMLKKDYGPFANELLKINDEILGLNLLDAKGSIIRVFPENKNSTALGKKSQNYPSLEESYVKNEKFWISPPFKLFQGKQGFAIYFPIIKSGKLRGWFATVIQMDAFIVKFKPLEFSKSNELIIADHASESHYFSSAMNPDKTVKIHKTAIELYGRKFNLISWKKSPRIIYNIKWYWRLLAALLLTLGFSYFWQLKEKHKQSKQQLQDIRTLLKITSSEALTKLVEVQNKNHDTQAEDELIIPYLSNLVEQIDLLETLAQNPEGMDEEVQPILPLLEQQLLMFSEVANKRRITFVIDNKSFQNVLIKISGWLLQKAFLEIFFPIASPIHKKSV